MPEYIYIYMIRKSSGKEYLTENKLKWKANTETELKHTGMVRTGRVRMGQWRAVVGTRLNSGVQ